MDILKCVLFPYIMAILDDPENLKFVIIRLKS